MSIFLEERLREARAERDALAERVRVLTEKLDEALDLADEGWGYADAYFCEKWDYAGRRAALAAAATTEEGA